MFAEVKGSKRAGWRDGGRRVLMDSTILPLQRRRVGVLQTGQPPAHWTEATVHFIHRAAHVHTHKPTFVALSLWGLYFEFLFFFFSFSFLSFVQPDPNHNTANLNLTSVHTPPLTEPEALHLKFNDQRGKGRTGQNVLTRRKCLHSVGSKFHICRTRHTYHFRLVAKIWNGIL